jgi:hypothetical protein
MVNLNKYNKKQNHKIPDGFSGDTSLKFKPSGLHHNWTGIQTEQTKGKHQATYKAKLRELKAVTSKEASKANKRIDRLQNKGLITPALDKWLGDGGTRFSVKGKSYNETQAELARIRQFNNAKTSTIRGANEVLKTMANNIGMEYKSVTQIQAQAGKFFELSSKVEQYIDSMDGSASAIGYQAIWEAINQYTQTQKIELDNLTQDFDAMVEEIAHSITYERDVDLINKTTDSDGYVWI